MFCSLLYINLASLVLHQHLKWPTFRHQINHLTRFNCQLPIKIPIQTLVFASWHSSRWSGTVACDYTDPTVLEVLFTACSNIIRVLGEFIFAVGNHWITSVSAITSSVIISNRVECFRLVSKIHKDAYLALTRSVLQNHITG